MNRVLILTMEKQFFTIVKNEIKKHSSVEIHTFTNSLELVNHFLANYAQLVVLDIDLLKEEVLKLIRVLRSIHRETKFILLLSQENMPICTAALSTGIISYQIKPLSVKSAREIITSFLQTQTTHN